MLATIIVFTIFFFKGGGKVEMYFIFFVLAHGWGVVCVVCNLHYLVDVLVKFCR